MSVSSSFRSNNNHHPPSSATPRSRAYRSMWVGGLMLSLLAVMMMLFIAGQFIGDGGITTTGTPAINAVQRQQATWDLSLRSSRGVVEDEAHRHHQIAAGQGHGRSAGQGAKVVAVEDGRRYFTQSPPGILLIEADPTMRPLQRHNTRFGATLLPVVVAGGGVGQKRCPLPPPLNIHSEGFSSDLQHGEDAMSILKYPSLLGAHPPCVVVGEGNPVVVDESSSYTPTLTSSWLHRSISCAAPPSGNTAGNKLRSELQSKIQRIRGATKERFGPLQVEYQRWIGGGTSSSSTHIATVDKRSGMLQYPLLRYTVGLEVAYWVLWAYQQQRPHAPFAQPHHQWSFPRPRCLTEGLPSHTSSSTSSRLNLFQCAMDIAAFGLTPNTTTTTAAPPTHHMCLQCHSLFQVSPPQTQVKNAYMLPSTPHTPHEMLVGKLLSVLLSGELPLPPTATSKGDGDGAVEVSLSLVGGPSPPSPNGPHINWEVPQDVGVKCKGDDASRPYCVVHLSTAVAYMRRVFSGAVLAVGTSSSSLLPLLPSLPDTTIDTGRLVHDCLLDLRRPSSKRTNISTTNTTSNNVAGALMSTGYTYGHFPRDAPLMGSWRTSHRRPLQQQQSKGHNKVGPHSDPAIVIPLQETTSTTSSTSFTGFPRRSSTFQSYATKFAKTSWIAAHNVCGICEHRRGKGTSWGGGSAGGGNRGGGQQTPSTTFDFRKFYMEPTAPCVLSLFSVGPTEDGLFHLQNKHHDGRSGIYTFREGGFQYAGHVRRVQDLVEIAQASQQHAPHNTTTTPKVFYVPGTSVLNAAYAMNNIGHSIQDALWGYTQTLLIARLAKSLGGRAALGPNANTSIAASGAPPSTKGSGGGSRKRVLPDVQDELPFLFPTPTRTIFTNHFGTVASDYYGAVSSAVAMSILGEEGSLEFPSSSSSPRSVEQDGSSSDSSSNISPSDVLCFETFLAGGIDRGLERGHYNSVTGREVVAKEIRKAVFDEMESSTPSGNSASQSPSISTPQLYVYGRNDVHRRSVRNIATLVLEATSITRLLNLPDPILLSTFDLSPLHQARLSRGMDVLLTVQGAHMQNSLFMPRDGAVIEVAACGSDKVSFLKRYSMYLPSTQRYHFIPLCGENSEFSGGGGKGSVSVSSGGSGNAEREVISSWKDALGVAGMTGPGLDNFGEGNVGDQNITVCPGHMARIKQVVMQELVRVRAGRKDHHPPQPSPYDP